ncbi:hypothetical protein G7Y89_g3159 [Cudoniella acicularis]|uniref:Uncharacterized protein n=1 Tax=Cudoniella acicularis TaxID=354080 RepID=A0A8H4RTV1_9HELO|nr:hypothetical protein G7Y89_g3159 [Cudoniella acicularis]
MRSQAIDEQIYEAMRMGKSVPFEFTTGGVKYKAVLQHKEARTRPSQTNTESSVASFSSSASDSNHQMIEDKVTKH